MGLVSLAREDDDSYVDLVSSGRPLPSFPKMACPQGHMFYIGLYRESMEKSSCLKQQCLEP